MRNVKGHCVQCDEARTIDVVKTAERQRKKSTVLLILFVQARHALRSFFTLHQSDMFFAAQKLAYFSERKVLIEM